jgi:replicative DNA helicase
MAALLKLSQYGKSFQLKVIGSLLTDKKFLLQIRDVLYVEYFDADAHKWIITEILKYFDRYHTTITLDVLKINLQKVDNDVLKTAVKEELRNSYQASQEDLEYVQEEFSTFAKNQELKTALLQSADLLNTGDYDGIRSIVEKALKAGMDKNIGHEYLKDIESRYREDYRPTLPSPWPVINENIQGGWGPGDLIIVFGNPGGGKCVDGSTEIEIEYSEYGIELLNNVGKPYTLWIKPWEEFVIEDYHLYGWQIYSLLK